MKARKRDGMSCIAVPVVLGLRSSLSGLGLRFYKDSATFELTNSIYEILRDSPARAAPPQGPAKSHAGRWRLNAR
eukprot:6204270-Pleurochrysis_carterae.AAC.2